MEAELHALGSKARSSVECLKAPQASVIVRLAHPHVAEFVTSMDCFFVLYQPEVSERPCMHRSCKQRRDRVSYFLARHAVVDKE